MPHIVKEAELVATIKKTKKALLIEPSYTRKYLPLGLAKIATAIKENGGSVIYSRYWPPDDYDTIFVTSLFTYDSKKVHEAIPRMLFMSPKKPLVYLGGVYASLMPEHAMEATDANIFEGCSSFLDQHPPDYTIDWQLKNPWDKFSYCFTSRGCPNKCPYCAVWRLEPKLHIIDGWEKHINLDKPYIMISDNNLSSQPIEHFENVVRFIYDSKKTVLFNNGFDCKHITPSIAKMLGKLKFLAGGGMRVAFDRIEEDGVLQQAVRLLIENGVKKSGILSFVLFNFMDKPQEANYRMMECLKLGIRPYPQQYTPLNQTSRKSTYIGKYWTKNLRDSFRFFWLMAGYYTKMSFMEFIQQTDRYELTSEDIDVWNTN